MGVGSVFLSMDYASVEEHLNKLIENGEKELKKLEEEKSTMQKELDVRPFVFDQAEAVCSLRRSCCSGLTVHWVVCSLCNCKYRKDTVLLIE